MCLLHGSFKNEVSVSMIDKLFDGNRWVITRIARAERVVLNLAFPALYIAILMAVASGKCFWLTVMSLTKGPRFYADACDGRYGWR